MIFNSVTYLVFLAFSVALYWWLPRGLRLFMLFTASIVFYGFWSFAFAPLMLVSCAIDYVAARAIHASDRQDVRRRYLWLSVACNLSLLGFFKYYYFFSENVSGLFSLWGADAPLPVMNILLPIGISFYTFQSISYTVDVYRGFIKPVREFMLFAVYVMYFPQLIAGPILRAKEVIWQLDVRPAFQLQFMASGIRLVLLGLFLKVVLADNVGPVVDDAFRQDASSLGPIDTLTMAFLFGFQIYFDFAAYSMIAIGSALLMGLRFPDNFNFPSVATSPRDFWRRWHISLSSWIRDYLYLPLLGAKVEDRSTGGLAIASPQVFGARVVFALFATWALMGLWHGAGWNFVIWGIWHACLVQAYRMSEPLRVMMPGIVRSLGGWAITLPLVMLAWIPFRAQSVDTTLTLLGHLLSFDGWFTLGFRENTYLVAFLVMGGVVTTPAVWRKFVTFREYAPKAAGIVEFVALTLVAALTFIYLQTKEQFIYFQF